MKKTIIALTLGSLFTVSTASALDWKQYVPSKILNVLGMQEQPPAPIQRAPIQSAVEIPEIDQNAVVQPAANIPSIEDTLTQPAAIEPPKVTTGQEKPQVILVNKQGEISVKSDSTKADKKIEVKKEEKAYNPFDIGEEAKLNPFSGDHLEIEAKKRRLEEAKIESQLLEEQIKQIQLQERVKSLPIRIKAETIEALRATPELFEKVVPPPPPSIKNKSDEVKPIIQQPVIKKGSPIQTGGLKLLQPKKTDYDLQQEEARFKAATKTSPIPQPRPVEAPKNEIRLQSIFGTSEGQTAVVNVNGTMIQAKTGTELLKGLTVTNVGTNQVSLSDGKILNLGNVVTSQNLTDRGSEAGTAQGGAVRLEVKESSEMSTSKVITAPAQPVASAPAPTPSQTSIQPVTRNAPPPPPPMINK